MSDAVNDYARGGALVAEARGRAEEWHLVYGEPNYPENLTLALALADALEVAHAFDALLSDKAIEAAHSAYVKFPKTRGIGSWKDSWRAALEAAVAAVTEGDNDE